MSLLTTCHFPSLQGIKAPEGPPPEDPFQPAAPTVSARGPGSKAGSKSPPQHQVQQQKQPEAQQAARQAAQNAKQGSNSSGDLAAMPFDALPPALQVFRLNQCTRTQT